MRKAVVDLGTNTFNLLIADRSDDSISEVYSTKRGVALGMGGITKGILTEDAIERAIKALVEFEEIIKNYKVSSVKLIATAAVREANNSDEFLRLVKEKVGREVLIIDGNKEAEYIYKGVSLCNQFDSNAMIMDIGGGSTEFIKANKNGMQGMISLKIGVSRLYQTFSCTDPFTDEDVKRIEGFIERESEDFFSKNEVDILIGSSGTFETFYELIYHEPFPKTRKTVELEIEPFMKSLNELIYSTQEERNQNQFIIPIRKKMAPFAAVKTKWVIERLRVKKILISPYSLKEGALTG